MKRFNVEITKDRDEYIKRIMDEMGLRTYRELLDHAVTITGWIVEQRKKGKKIGSYNEKEDLFLQLVMPAIEFIRPDSN